MTNHFSYVVLLFACHHFSEVISPHTDVRNKWDQAPLHRACVGGSKQVVQHLVKECKVDVGESFLLVGTVSLDPLIGNVNNP